jgi:abequosyltransferase
MKPLLSICIPSYNRPEQIAKLLASVDGDPAKIEIVVCEDHAPRRTEVRQSVDDFAQASRYPLRYFENDRNLGFDGNLRRLIEVAEGAYVTFMGDDDLFIAGALDKFIGFVEEHLSVKYFLRSHIAIHSNGNVETFRYLPASRLIPPGEESVAWLFKRSVTICGFTIDRDAARAVATDDLDGTLLYQVYAMAEVCLNHESMYCDIPLVQAVQSFRGDNPGFGSSAAERGRYTPGKISADNSINFTKAYFEVTGYIDKRHGTTLTPRVRKILSTFAYPFLSIQRKRGFLEFLRYAGRLERECGFACTPYYYVYKWGLAILGESACDWLITKIKGTVGYTPMLGNRPA